ncbi:MAG: lytic transglycosylase domain-containing protein [Prolixibacteraceae bacterium]|nr:lytic transglycosylase domain-containing protein [Prolixibacteraceae bacterium]
MTFKIPIRLSGLIMALPVVFLIPLTACSNSGRQLPDSVGTHLFTPVELPEKLEFAGEKVPLEYYDVRENLDRELLSTVYFHSQTIRYIKNAPRYFSIIETILKSNGIPEDFKYLSVAESGFDVRAVSPAKAVGLWQLLESAAKENGLEINAEIDERYHIEKSTEAACRILKSAYQKYGSWSLVAASYNGGRAGLDQKIALQKVKNYYDLLFVEETTRYVFRILALKLVMENPEEYGFKVEKKDLYPIVETEKLEVKGPITDLAAFAIGKGITYKTLKMFNPWLRETFLKNTARKTYTLKIPEKDFRTKTN